MPEGSEVREADPLGIVVEGGGCRAIYAAGVLDVFDAAEPLMREVKGVLGVSAGATPRASSRASAAEAFGSTSASRRTSASGASAGGFAPDA